MVKVNVILKGVVKFRKWALWSWMLLPTHPHMLQKQDIAIIFLWMVKHLIVSVHFLIRKNFKNVVMAKYGVALQKYNIDYVNMQCMHIWYWNCNYTHIVMILCLFIVLKKCEW